MFKLTHRRLALLNYPWLAAYYGRPNHCLLCSSNSPETYSHVFSDCTFATQLWSSLDAVTRALGGSTTSDQRPARLVGDLTTFSVERLTRRWAAAHHDPQPTPDKVVKWQRRAWGETRAMVLKCIWEARCDLLHNNVDSQTAAAAQASSRLQQRLLSAASPVCSSVLPASVLTTSTAEDKLNRITWGRVASSLLLERHIPAAE